LTVPLPLPLPPLVTVIQVALLVAVHAQPVVVVTDTLAAPPAAVGLADVGDAVKLQPAAWLMVTVCPATVSVPVRAGPVFAATV
jgi:hypothetical protein